MSHDIDGYSAAAAEELLRSVYRGDADPSAEAEDIDPGAPRVVEKELMHFQRPDPITPSEQLGRDLCKALGLEGQIISELKLELDANSFPTLRVTRYIATPEELEQLVGVLEKYRLNPELIESAAAPDLVRPERALTPPGIVLVPDAAPEGEVNP